MKTTQEWLLENAGIFSMEFALKLHEREQEIFKSGCQSARSIVEHHAKCYREPCVGTGGEVCAQKVVALDEAAKAIKRFEETK